MENDIIDNILQIGDSNYIGDNVLTQRFQSFYESRYGLSDVQLQPISLLYMIYSSILAIPLTNKMEKYQIEGILLRKAVRTVKLVVSYNTNDGAVFLKVILITFGSESKPISYPLLKDLYVKLKSLKKTEMSQSTFRNAMTQINCLNIQDTESGRMQIVTRKYELNINPGFLESSKITRGFIPVKPKTTNLYPLVDTYLKNLQSDSTVTVKMGAYSIVKILVTEYQVLSRKARLSNLPNSIYSFVLGTLEINFATSYNLIVHPVLSDNGKAVNQIIILNGKTPTDWTSSSPSIVLKLIDSNTQPQTDQFKEQLIEVTKEMRFSEYGLDKDKIIIIGIDYENVIKAFTIPAPQMKKVDIDHLQASTQTLVEEIDAETKFHFVDELLALDNFRENGPSLIKSIDTFIKSLAIEKGQHTLKTYIYGQLMAKDSSVEKYVFKSEYWDDRVTTILFRHKNSARGISVIIVDSPVSSSGDVTSIFRHYFLQGNVPANQLNFENCVQIVMSDSSDSILYANEINFKDSLNVASQHSGTFHKIPDLKPDEVISHLETCPEEYQSIRNSATESIFSSIKSDLSGKFSQLTDADIMHFFQGFFSGYKQIRYAHDFLGVMAEENKPLFISTVATDSHQRDSENELEKVAAEYISDYAHSEGRRRASFVCIGHNTQDVGLMKFTTYGKHKQTFESCILGIGYHRKKRANPLNIACPAKKEEKILDEQIKFGNVRKSLQTVGKVSQILMTAQIFKSMISALIRQDYKEFSLNAAFLVSGPLMESLSIKLMTQGAKMSRVLAGRTLMIGAPFLARLPMSGFIVYDLIQQIKDFRAGNLDAKVNIIGDSSILAIEFASASIEGMEAVGLVSGVADFFGPVGFAVSTAIFIGTDIYSAVKSVEKINQIIHLTTWQRFQTGFLAFWHLSPAKSVQTKIDEKIIADLTQNNAARFFEQYPFVGFYFFPAYKLDGKFIENSSLNLAGKKGMIDYTTSKMPGFLTPICTEQYPYHVCRQMVGYRNTYLSNLTVILLGNGTDKIKTFVDKSTTFLIGNGVKNVVGSQKSDTFILNGETTEGYLNGLAGFDTLNTMHFSVDNIIYFNMTINTLTYLDKKLKVFNTNNFIGRPNARDVVECSCRTTFVETLGGKDLSNPDHIIIPSNKNCSFNLMIKVDGNIDIENFANNSKFQYALFGAFHANISFNNSFNSTNIFFFNFPIEEVEQLTITIQDHSSYQMNLETKNSILHLRGVDDNLLLKFSNNSQFRINKNTSLISIESDETIENIQNKYFKLARQLKAIVNIYSRSANISCLFGTGSAIYHNNSEDINHINMLPNDPYHATHLFGGLNQNVFRISMPDLHNNSILSEIPPVTIYNYTYGNGVNVLDLYEMIILVTGKLNGGVFVQMTNNSAEDILMKVFANYNSTQLNVINITLNRALIGNNSNYLIINMRRPMRIMYHNNKIILAPIDYYLKNSSYTLIHKGLVEPYTTIVLEKYLINYETFAYKNNSLILTNVNFVDAEEDLVLLIFENFFIEKELQTLRLKFEDQTLLLNTMLEEIIQESDEFEDWSNLNDDHMPDWIEIRND